MSTSATASNGNTAVTSRPRPPRTSRTPTHLQPVASCLTPSPAASAQEPTLPQRLLVPGNVPVAAELAALLGVVGDLLEPEPLVERDRCWVRDRDAAIGPMDVLCGELPEEGGVERGADAAPGAIGGTIDGRLDRGF